MEKEPAKQKNKRSIRSEKKKLQEWKICVCRKYKPPRVVCVRTQKMKTASHVIISLHISYSFVDHMVSFCSIVVFIANQY